MLGLIGGTSLLFSDLAGYRRRTVHTPYGTAEVLEGRAVLLLRHQGARPPHRINHRANLSALALLGVGRVIAISSVGSLKKGIAPGSMLIPDDYISLSPIPTIHDHAIVHTRPELSAALNEALSGAVPEARRGGVYVQTPGPRIETVAEVRALAGIADVVGMTLASEATLASELGIGFAALCMVDNYAHGLGEERLTYEHIVETARRYRERTDAILERILEELGGMR